MFISCLESYASTVNCNLSRLQSELLFMNFNQAPYVTGQSKGYRKATKRTPEGGLKETKNVPGWIKWAKRIPKEAPELSKDLEGHKNRHKGNQRRAQRAQSVTYTTNIAINLPIVRYVKKQQLFICVVDPYDIFSSSLSIARKLRGIFCACFSIFLSFFCCIFLSWTSFLRLSSSRRVSYRVLTLIWSYQWYQIEITN